MPHTHEHLPYEDFDLYQGVVTAAYQFHDLMLGRLLELAGDDATVLIVSDHGYQTPAPRPADATASAGNYDHARCRHDRSNTPASQPANISTSTVRLHQ